MAPQRRDLPIGAQVTYQGKRWTVWCQAPAHGHWWIYRQDEDGSAVIWRDVDSILLHSVHDPLRRPRGHKE